MEARCGCDNITVVTISSGSARQLESIRDNPWETLAFEAADGGGGSALTSPFKPVTLRFDSGLTLSAQTQSVKLPVIRDASRRSEFAHRSVPTEIYCCSAAERQACALTQLNAVG